MSIFNSLKEREVKKEIMNRAIKMATEQYSKEIMFQTLQTSDLNYSIIQDLIKAAKFTGSVQIKLKDGTEITIKSDDDEIRKQLNSEQLY